MKNFITVNNPVYPNLLKQIYRPPQKLYYKGDISLLQKSCFSVVGTRKHSEYGEMMTNKILEEISVLDFAIVSGLAKGIDTLTHRKALELNLPTIAVLGSGIDNIYPRENAELAEKIIQKGLIISEFEPNEEPKKTNFPQRNRIISGLCVGTLVIEAPESSGALITARYALEQGREIFTVPGDIDRENSLGPLRLLQFSAAYPVSSGQDIIDILKKQPHLFALNERPVSPRANAVSPRANAVSPRANAVSPHTNAVSPRANAVSPHTNTAKAPFPHAPTWRHASTSAPASNQPRKQNPLPLNLSPPEKEIFSLLSARRPRDMDYIMTNCALSPAQILSTLSLLEIKGLIQTKDGKYLSKC